MKFSLAVVVTFLTAACSTPTSTEATDSTEVTVDTMAMATSDPILIDTTYTEVLEVETSFTAPQLNERIAYVYSTSGLDVFESARAEKAIGHVDYGAMVR